MADGANRLFRLVDLLQARGAMTASGLAAELGVSERTVRRDLVRLADLEVPVVVRPGRGGGASVAPGALLAPLRFTDDELLALLLGLRSLTPAGERSLGRAAASAIKRLESVLTPRARDRARAVTTAVASAPRRDRSPPEAAADSARVLEVAEAVHARRGLVLRYGAQSGAETNRRVDPYGLVHLDHWYLAAHCHLRGALRTFRLDRIRGLDVLDTTFSLPEAFDAFAAVAASIALAPAPGSIVCRVRIETDLESAARVLPPAAAVLEPVDGGILLTTRAYPDELERIGLHLLRLPWPVQVLEPDDLRTALRRVARRADALADAEQG